ncbi:MAG: DUF3352 domain-containing protein [Bacteroidota bacterium]
MKKKLIIWISLLLIVGLIIYFAIYLFFSPTHSFQGIYAVPHDAIYVIETEEPIQNWIKIRSSNMWAYLQGNDFFSSLTQSINSLDTLVQENRTLLSLIGSRQVFISAHITQPNNYDFLYIVDLQRVSKLSPLKSYIESLTNKGYKTTFRKYKDEEIIEITDLKTRETLYISLLNNLLVISYTHTLVEASIVEMAEPIIGRDLQFIVVKQKVDYNDAFRLYINYQYLDDFLTLFSDDDAYSKYLSEVFSYTAMGLALEENDKIALEGFTNLSNDKNPYLEALLKSGKGTYETFKIAPLRTGFYMGIGFDNFRDFIENFETASQSDEASFSEYMQNMDKIERFLDIDLQENFFNWIDNEIAFIQTQPGKLGKNNEFVVVLKAKSADRAIENLTFIGNQIRKKTPVKFRHINYKGYQIKYLSVKGFFKLILGKFFSKLDKPYFTTINDFVVFSNHPQTIKGIIDDYDNKNTLANSTTFQSFFEGFEKKANVFAYVQTPVMFENLQPMVNEKTWTSLNKNREYLVCFSDIGLQIGSEEGLFTSKLHVQFQDRAKLKDLEAILAATVEPFNLQELDSVMQLTLVEKDDELIIDEISPDDLDAKKYKEYYNDGN